MKFAGKIAMCSAVLGTFLIPAMAQTADPTPTPAPPTKKPATIQQRKENQQQRIGEGVESGQLTAGETRNLETKEAAINKEEKNMKADGNFTPAERARIQRQQNRLSNQIYRDKHNARVQPTPTTEVGARKEMQQKRIGEGIENGSLTAGEAAHLENKEVKLNKETTAMRAANGGTLTPGEKAKVNRQQNRLSNQIYNKKHNARHQ
jgi:hypothetical protein